MKRSHAVLVAGLLALAFSVSSYAQQSKLAQNTPMGWNNWNRFHSPRQDLRRLYRQPRPRAAGRGVVLVRIGQQG